MDYYLLYKYLMAVCVVFVQATAALRNLADTGASRERLLGCQAIESLCLIVDNFTSDGDLMLNVSRIFR